MSLLLSQPPGWSLSTSFKQTIDGATKTLAATVTDAERRLDVCPKSQRRSGL
jgi:hypothetical protein